MNINFQNNKGFIYIIPLVYILWSIFLLHINGSFYLTRIDPEFPYLMNGLNCARLDFSRIGLVEHPGTPFHIFTGIFIRIIYWIFGQGTIVEDVILRPEMYLTGSSFILALITSLILFWYGRMALKYNLNILAAILLQSTVFINLILIDLPRRYIPDRMLFIYVLIFIGLCLKYLYQKDYNGKKFAFHSGILMGIGFVTKFHFLPILILPFIIVSSFKEKLIYIGTFIISCFISFLPILDKFSHFRNFIVGIFTHDGLYGGGSEQVFNMQTYWMNLFDIFQQNVPFSIILIIAVVLVCYMVIKRNIRKTHKKEFVILIAIILASSIGALMIAKHYKNYYVIPLVSLSAFAFLVILKISRDIFKFRYLNLIFGLLLIVMVILPVSKLYTVYAGNKIKNHQNFITANYIKYHVPTSDYFFIEPTWMSGPMVTNGLVYGMSYVNHHNFYYNDFEKYYPHIITWEGKTKPVSFFRMLPADNESIFKSGKSIYVLSTPGRYAHVLCNYIDSCATHYEVELLQDTVFTNSVKKEFVIRFKHNDTWNTKVNSNCGFEKVINNQVYTDDEQFALTGSFSLTDEEICNGLNSLKLNKSNPRSPAFVVQELQEGDYIELTVKRRGSSLNPKGNLYIEINSPDTSNIILAKGKYLTRISDKWEIMRVSAEVGQLPADATIHCYYQYPGDKAEHIDDLSLRYCSPN